MNLESRLKDIHIALKLADWFSTEERIDYNIDPSLGFLFTDGKIVFLDNTILEFTESITPERFMYRYQYMKADGSLIFRYDNVPHHPEVSTFSDHKHYHNKIVESSSASLKQEEYFDLLNNI